MAKHFTTVDTKVGEVSVYQCDNGYDDERMIVHYTGIPFPAVDTEGAMEFLVNQSNHIEFAKRMLKGKKYRARDFGGGIVFHTNWGCKEDVENYVKESVARALAELNK